MKILIFHRSFFHLNLPDNSLKISRGNEEKKCRNNLFVFLFITAFSLFHRNHSSTIRTPRKKTVGIALQCLYDSQILSKY